MQIYFISLFGVWEKTSYLNNAFHFYEAIVSVMIFNLLQAFEINLYKYSWKTEVWEVSLGKHTGLKQYFHVANDVAILTCSSISQNINKLFVS